MWTAFRSLIDLDVPNIKASILQKNTIGGSPFGPPPVVFYNASYNFA